MTVMPEAARKLLHEAPELVALTSEAGDLLAREWWGAVFSPGEPAQHRYLLWRIWDVSLPLLMALMLNPSKADHLADDRTVAGIQRRARKGFVLGRKTAAAKTFRAGGVLIANCFAFRATDPDDMKSAADPVGPWNDRAIELALQDKPFLLCAWGVHARHLNREEQVKCLIRKSGQKPHALRLTADGHPSHPLYLPAAIEPFEWAITSENGEDCAKLESIAA